MQKLYLGNGPYVFMSYSFKDKEKAIKLSQTLILSGCNLWLDTGIASREDAEQKLKDAFCVILLVTRNSIVSRHVGNDITIAHSYKKPVFTVYLDDFGFRLSDSGSNYLAECGPDSFDENLFKLRDKIISKLPPHVLRKTQEPFYVGELNRFYTEINWKESSFGICVINEKGEKTTLWSYAPSDEYNLNASLCCVDEIDNPYFSNKNSKNLVASFVLSFIAKKDEAMKDCDIVVTVAISRLDEEKPRITLVNCESLFDSENMQGLISHIEKSFK